MIRWLLVSWASNALVLGLVGWLLSGVTFHGETSTVIWAALVFGILNTIVKPIVKLITLPLAVLTLGIAWFFVSMLMLWLTTLIIGNFDIDGFWNYVWATILIWIVNMLLDIVVFGITRGGSTASTAATA